MEEKYWADLKEKSDLDKRKKLPKSNAKAPSPLKGLSLFRSKFADEYPNFYELSPKQKRKINRDRFKKIMSFDVTREVSQMQARVDSWGQQ